jgi:hypothetical protein
MAAVRQGVEQTGGLQIAEVSEVAGDAALQARRIGAATQQIRIMVELQDQGVAIPEGLLMCGVTQPASVNIPRRRPSASNTNWQGSRASWGTG